MGSARLGGKLDGPALCLEAEDVCPERLPSALRWRWAPEGQCDDLEIKPALPWD